MNIIKFLVEYFVGTLISLCWCVAFVCLTLVGLFVLVAVFVYSDAGVLFILTFCFAGLVVVFIYLCVCGLLCSA